MNAELKVHPSFFREFATKTWVSPNDIVKELIENAFDEDATQVIVTLQNNGNLTIEDNAGMDNDDMEKFLLLGSPHKVHETISPKLKRIRTGRYGTGRLSFLTSFEKMKIRRTMTWHSKITFLKKYEYIDEMLAGPFKKWRHLHKFHSIDGKQTEIIDEIEFELPYGILGMLQNIFA